MSHSTEVPPSTRMTLQGTSLHGLVTIVGLRPTPRLRLDGAPDIEPAMFTMLSSEEVLSRIWDDPAEDDAWRTL